MLQIVKRYGATTALAGVSLQVRAGEIHALLGENGAGKSTLMHVLSGLTRANSGHILLDANSVKIDSPRTARALGIAMVHQHFTLVPAFSIAANLALDAPRPRFGLNYRIEKAAAPALDRAASLGWHLDAQARVTDLPVGVQQRVEIVKALATGARLVIFDEPTAVLAGDEVEDLFGVLRLLRAEGKAIILIAHKLAEILAVADRVTVLRRGHNVASCPVADTNARQLAEWMIGSAEKGSGIRGQESAKQATGNREPQTPDADAPSRHRHPSAGRLAAGLPDGNFSARSKDEGEKGANGASSQISNLKSQVSVFNLRDLVVKGERGETALFGISFEVARGEIFGIGGVDGNGQTELAEALAGLRRIESGALLWEESDFVPGLRPRIGYIPQDRRRAGLALGLSVEDNLLFEAVQDAHYRLGPFLRHSRLRKLANRLIAEFDIRTADAKLPASSLSGGNQQKIVVARALNAQPELIVATNPTRGLDIGATRFVHTQLRAARERAAAVVLISTDLDELAALADRGAVLSGGRLRPATFAEPDSAELGLLMGGVEG